MKAEIFISAFLGFASVTECYFFTPIVASCFSMISEIGCQNQAARPFRPNFCKHLFITGSSKELLEKVKKLILTIILLLETEKNLVYYHG